MSGFDESKINELSEPVSVVVHRMIGQKPSPVALPPKPGWDVPGTGLTLDEVRCLDRLLATDYDPGDYVVTATGENGQQFKWNAYFPPRSLVDVAPRPNGRVAQNGGGQAQQVSFGTENYVAPGPPGWMTVLVPEGAQVRGTGTPRMREPYWSLPPAGAPAPDAAEVRVARLEAQMERERQDAKHTAEMAALREEMRRIAEGGQRRSGDDDAVAELKRQNEELRRRLDAEAEKRAADERFNALQRQIEAQNLQFQALMAKLSERPHGPDPTTMLLVETMKAQTAAQADAARQAADAAKDVARIQADAAKEAARTQMGPREMMDLMTRLAPNNDKTADAFGKIMDLQTRVMENALQLQSPPTNPALEMAGRAAEGILGVAQQYIQMKEQAAKDEAHAKVAQAQMVVQAQAIQAQQQLSAPPQPDEEGDEEEDDQASVMEEELFGPAMEHVERLRLGVSNGQLTPEQAAQAVLQGIGHFQHGGKKTVKAFELWRQGNIAEFVGVLIPGALDSYKSQMAQVLFDARNSGARA